VSLFKGKKAENFAENFLNKKNLITLHRNYLCKTGEIDLIMLDKDQLVFVEVRARSKAEYGSAAETVDIKKQKKIIASAKLFLLENPQLNTHMCRFDVFEINDFNDSNQEPSWIQDAFILNNFSVL